MKKQLQFGIFIALVLVCAFALWAFVANKTAQTTINQSDNATKPNEMNLSVRNLQSAGNFTKSQNLGDLQALESAGILQNPQVLKNPQPLENSQGLKKSQNLTNLQALQNVAPTPAQATKTSEKKRVKGLLVDYDADELNSNGEFSASEFKSDKISVETNLDASFKENVKTNSKAKQGAEFGTKAFNDANSNAKFSLNAEQNAFNKAHSHTNSSANLNLDAKTSTFDDTNFSVNLNEKIKPTPNSKALRNINSSKKPNLSALNDTNATPILDTSAILVRKKHYANLLKLIQKGYAKSFFAQKADKNATIKDAISVKPKLCIIIDDMASREQVRELKATGLKLVPSFFPPDSNHPKTPTLAREFEFFMVHLPLAAVHYSYEERDTLSPHDSQERINAKIAQIARDFKGLKFINNHTGSLFTDDTQAMRRLFRALKQHGLIFVDSMTISSSKGALVSREFSQMPIKRDIFLDNENDIGAIKAKIKQAVRKAHKKGFAIAIAHPKKNTFEALKQSKELLQSVELVYLSEVYENP